MLRSAMLGKENNASSLRTVMKICGTLCRRKQVDDSNCQSSLARVLNTLDLTALGIGSTLGVGIYVLAGDVSKTVAGPAVVISFLLAAIASLFAGLCYAEFGARVPKAGSAYIYSYYCVGELAAFIIGWCLILEYVIGAASVARGISTYIDCLLSGKIKGIFMAFAPMEATFMSPYVDFFSFGLCIILACALASGVRESTMINNFLTFCNMSLVSFIIISGLFKIDPHNWQLEKSELPGPEAGEGGFAPFGIIGIIKGAAICFYGFIGFDSIATTGEEVRNPQKAIPLSILISLLITFLAYFGVSSVLTLMWPYYLQDPDAPLPYVYSQIGWDAAKWLVSVGALFGLFSSLYGAMFPLPRIIYSMACDGLIFRVLSDVSPRTKTPVVGTVIAGMVTATMSALFNLQQLISLMALGTLLAYTIVAVSVLILRYSPDFDENCKEIGETTGLVSNGESTGVKRIFMNYFSCGVIAPTVTSKTIVIINIVLYCASSLFVSLLLMRLESDCNTWRIFSLVFICIFGTVMLIVFLSLSSQPKARKSIPFQMPFVPLLPCISIFLNIYLMVFLDQTTWIKLAIWMCAGVIPYLCWYYWKYRHGELGENSRYNINRVNNIKLNELVWKLVREKKVRLDGYVNEAYISDIGPSKATVKPSSTTETESKSEEIPKPQNKNLIYDEIYVYNESQKTVEIVEINNNIYRAEEPEDEKWRSVVEVHATVGDETTEDLNKRVEEGSKVEEKSEESVDDSPAEELKEPDIVPTMDKKESETNTSNGRIQILQKNNVLSDEFMEKIFGPEIPIRRRIVQQPRVKLNLDKKIRRNITESELLESVSEVKPEESKIKRGNGLVSKEMLEKLNQIIRDQSSFIQSGLVRPSAEIVQNTEDTPERHRAHLEIKTLTKMEIKSKLQHLLQNGPPKKPSFRKSAILEKPSEDESEADKG